MRGRNKSYSIVTFDFYAAVITSLNKHITDYCIAIFRKKQIQKKMHHARYFRTPSRIVVGHTLIMKSKSWLIKSLKRIIHHPN
jgi:hypothetical protein